MKATFSNLLIFMMSLLPLSATAVVNVSAEEAVAVVSQHLNSADVELSYGDTGNNEWLVMADPTPTANWCHPVTYFYVPKYSESSDISISRSKPANRLPKIPMTKVGSEIATHSFAPFWYQNVPKRDVPENKHIYAVILSGGIDPESNYWRYWNDCSYLYRVLRNHFNVPKENIFPVMADGADPAIDNNLGLSSSPDLDGDGEDDVEYAATLDNLTLVFNALKNKMTRDDHLLFYVIDHGGYDEKINSPYICLWEEENLPEEESRLYPMHLDAWFNYLDAGSIHCAFGQCYSGGFVKKLQAPNRILVSACEEDQLSYASSSSHYDAFVNAWTTSLFNGDRIEQYHVVPADDNGDGYVNTKESFNFAYQYDEMGPNGQQKEVPQYYCGYEILAQDLCIDRLPPATELIIRDSYSDVGIVPSQTETHDSPDIWVRNAPDGVRAHQQPIFTTRGAIENYVYVRITNKSVFDYDPANTKRYLHLNWAKGAPAHKYSTYSGQFSSMAGEKDGGAIKSVLIDEVIESEDQTIICVPWRTSGYPAELNGEPLSILATISDQPYGLAYDVTRGYYSDIAIKNPLVKTKSHNNVAVKSHHIIQSDNEISATLPLRFQNLSTDTKYYTIRLTSSMGDKVVAGLHLPEGTYLQSSIPSEHGIAPHLVIDCMSDFYTNNGSVSLSYLPLEVNDFKALELTADIMDASADGNVDITVKVMEYPSDKVAGTYNFSAKIVNGKFASNNGGIIVYQLDASTYELYCVNSENITDLKWLDEDGAILSDADTLSLKLEESKVITLVRYDSELQSESRSSITLTPECGIKSVEKTLQDGSIKLNLNMPAKERMVVRAASVVRPYLCTDGYIEIGESEIRLSLDGAGEDMIVLSIEKDGRLLDSRTLK